MEKTYFKTAVNARQCWLHIEWTAGFDEAREAGESFDLAGQGVEEWRGENIHA